MMSLKQEIIESINLIVKDIMSKYENCDVPTVVEEVDAIRNRYLVTINGTKKYVKDGVGISPTVGQPVWVRVPNGDIKKSYIEARR